MSHEGLIRTGNAKLVYMANQIAAFFETMPQDESVAGVAKHINDFWKPRMRLQLFAILDDGGMVSTRWSSKRRLPSGGRHRRKSKQRRAEALCTARLGLYPLHD